MLPEIVAPTGAVGQMSATPRTEGPADYTIKIGASHAGLVTVNADRAGNREQMRAGRNRTLAYAQKG